MATLLSDRKDFCGDGSHYVSLSTSDFAEDGFRLHNFRHGEAPWQERELRTLVPLTLEVERNRNAATPLLKFQVTDTFLNFFNDLVARARLFKGDQVGCYNRRSAALDLPTHLNPRSIIPGRE